MDDIKAFLGRAEKLDALIGNKLIERDQWLALAVNVTARLDGDRVQATGSPSKMADAVTKCVDMEREIDWLIDRLIEEKQNIVNFIERLDSPTEYTVLHMRYIQFKPLQEIADHYRRDYSWATTTHGRALKNLRKIMAENISL